MEEIHPVYCYLYKFDFPFRCRLSLLTLYIYIFRWKKYITEILSQIYIYQIYVGNIIPDIYIRYMLEILSQVPILPVDFIHIFRWKKYILEISICQKYYLRYILEILMFQKYYPRCRFSLLTTASPLGPLTLGHLRRSNFLSNIFPTKCNLFPIVIF